ncbi:hypothetical protein [Streptomyces albogriseolus]|uniref:hypothetical protein n=1 Tax=Streptomyces albogriseolus TaxID=1887 RepID=UPI00345FF219
MSHLVKPLLKLLVLTYRDWYVIGIRIGEAFTNDVPNSGNLPAKTEGSGSQGAVRLTPSF